MNHRIDRIVCSLIIAVGLAAGGYLLGGRYTLLNAGGEFGGMVYRIDRYSGTVWICGGMLDEKGKEVLQCGYFHEGKPVQR